MTHVWVHDDPILIRLVIDGEVIWTTPEHPFYLSTGQWVDTTNLQEGDLIRNADWQVGVVNEVVTVYQTKPMYNLTVDTAHTYFVGEQQWLVHNICRSLIDADPRLVREAQKLGASHQRSINSLSRQLYDGNLNPGIGSRHLFGNVFEARARDGARVYFRVAEDGVVEILGKSTKSNQQRVIDILEELYGN